MNACDTAMTHLRERRQLVLRAEVLEHVLEATG